MKYFLASIKRFIRREPLFYFTLCGWKSSVRKLRGHPDSELILEAFPRSANTSSMYALYFAQGVDFKVGHHLHVPAHVKYAVKHQIPCLVIMRKPLDCIASLLIMRGGGDPRVLLKDYIDFAQVAVDLSEEVVIVSFNDVIESGMGRVVQKLNQRYKTDFKEPDGSDEEQAWVKDQIRNWNRLYSGGDEKKLSFPTEAKRKKAEGVKEQIREASDLLKQAEDMYRIAVERGGSL